MNRRLGKKLLILVVVVMASISLVAQVASAAQIGPVLTSAGLARSHK